MLMNRTNYLDVFRSISKAAISSIVNSKMTCHLDDVMQRTDVARNGVGLASACLVDLVACIRSIACLLLVASSGAFPSRGWRGGTCCSAQRRTKRRRDCSDCWLLAVVENVHGFDDVAQVLPKKAESRFAEKGKPDPSNQSTWPGKFHF